MPGFNKIYWLSGFIFLAAVSVHAANTPAALTVQPDKISPPIQAGVLTGGQASDPFSIISISQQTTSNGERLIITYGDQYGKPLTAAPGFFHAALDRGSKRIILDLAQVNRTAVDLAGLRKILERSQLISGSDMTMDPQDGSTNITLHLKNPIELRIALRSQTASQLVLEMKRRAGATAPIKSSEAVR